MMLPAWAKFSPGELVITPGALYAFQFSMERIVPYLLRHLQGDWGDLDNEDRRVNEHALVHGLRLLSAYTLSDGTSFWIITEADRSVSTFLLPSEY